jgi:NHLM bacteriocin system ABC transporter ATP-binding protein
MSSPFSTNQTLANLSASMRLRRPIIWRPDQGTLEERSANSPFAVDNPDEVFFVEAGSIDVFSVPPTPGNGTTGPRRYLWTVSQGEALFGLLPASAQSHHTVAVAAPGTRLRRLAFRDVQARAEAEDWVFTALVEGFVKRLASAMVSRPELDVILQEGSAAGVQLGKMAGPMGGLLWVRHTAGTSLLGGLAELPIGPNDPPLPLSKGLWLEAATEDVQLDVFDTQTCLASGEAFIGLGHLRSLFGTVITRVAELEERGELERLERKAQAETRLRTDSLNTLASVLVGPTLEAAVGGEEDPLRRACRVIGERQGIVFKAPPRWESAGRVRDPLAAICRASRVRTRRVTLRGEWWKTDSGHLLAFVDKTAAPVALLYTGRGYDLVEPATMKRRPVTQNVAAALNWEAYTFYKPLPDKPISGRDLVMRMLEESRPELRFILLTALGTGLLQLLIPIAMNRMLGQIVPAALLPQVWTLLLSLIGVHIGIAFFNLARAFTLSRVEGRSNASLQGALVDRLLALPVPFFRDNPVGELAGRALTINAARATLTGAAPVSVLAGVFSILYLILLVYYNWRLSLVALAMMLLSLWLVTHFAKKTVRAQRENLAVQGKVSGLVYQMISGIAKLRVAAAEGRLFARWAQGFKKQAELNFKAHQLQNVIKVYNDILPDISALALFWIAGYLVRNGHKIDTADFISFNSAYGALFASLTQLSQTLVNVMGVAPIIERAKPILEVVPEVEAAKPDPGSLAGRIEVLNVSFSYRKDGPRVLNDVSIAAMPGEYVALVGPSGSGKSTTLRMLLGFEEPTSGVVSYDGQDLRVVDLSGLRSQIGVVLQNSRLMSGSVFDNIVGSAPLTIDDAWSAAEMAGLADDIRDFPMGLHTVVAEGGANLSGGQQQRLLIARALVRRPRILFFDEATSALDNRTQQQVSESLERLNATRIVIAHRLSTIRNADKIYVMTKGEVAQSGSFSELAAQKGLFADLIARQKI